jgi:NTP pyrophosphatase (non-canonical NTP hydrolase)
MYDISDADVYQQWAESKWNGNGIHHAGGITQERAEQLLNAALGLMGEGGEYCDLVKKILFHKLPLGGAEGAENNAKLKKELGDLAYYLAMNCSLWGWTLSSVLDTNMKKLNARYPEGFDADRSNNRNEAGEG